MKILAQIEKTREYLDYIETHVLNVQKAWAEIQEKCNDMFFIQDDSYYESIGMEVQKHDLSKLSEYELVGYRKFFYPTSEESEFNSSYDISRAWEHHKESNRHHWENWTLAYARHEKKERCIHCVHMVIDWVAMGYHSKNTAQAYYEKNKQTINIPNDAIKLIYEIFERLEK